MAEPRDDVVRRLDRAFAPQLRGMHGRLDDIRDWQKTDRTYETVQAVLRGRSVSMSSFGAWCGRSETADVAQIVGADGHVLPGFTATSVDRAIAIDRFTSARGALIELALPKSTPAVWVGLLGVPRLRHQAELLLQDRLHITVADHRREGGLLVLSMAVIA